MRCLPLHLDAGSDVRRSLEQLAQQHNASGFVLSVVGNLAVATFQCPGKASPTVLSGELEIISLQGTLAPGGVHLHLSFSDGDCQVWGGHLEPGSLILRGADVLVGLFDGPAPLEIPAAAAGAAAAPAARRQPRVAIAVRPGCPYSNRALRLLRTLGIPYDLVEPSAGTSVPQVFLDGVLIGGYDALAELHGRGDLEALRTGL